MAKLREVWQAAFPGARVVAGASSEPGRTGGATGSGPVAGLEREVSWVRLMRPTVPAFDALAEGDLVILPPAVLRMAEAPGGDLESALEAMARARCCGIVSVPPPRVGDQSDGGMLTAALARASTSDLSIFEAAAGTDHLALERAVIGYLVNARAELDRQAAALESELERLALLGEGLDELIGATAGALSRAVALEGPRGEVLALHAPAAVDDAPAAAAAYLAQRRRAALRLPLPGGAGHLLLLGEDPSTELQRVAAGRISGLLALQVNRGGPTKAGSSSGTRADAVPAREALPGDGPPWVVIVARQLMPHQPASAADRQHSRDRLRGLLPARRMVLRGDATSLDLRAVVAPAGDDPLGLDIARRVATLLARPVAVSRPFSDPDERAVANADARNALEAWDALHPVRGTVPAAGSVVRADRLAAYRLLGGLRTIPDAPLLAESLLAPLTGGGPGSRARRLVTLRVLLEHPAQADAARALGVHRNTLAQRAARIEAITGWNLHDAELALALRIALELQALPPEA